MSAIRKKQVNDALAINSLDSVPVDSEMMKLLDAYSNDEIDYDDFANKVDEKVQRDIKNFNSPQLSFEENEKCNRDLMALISKSLR